MQILKKNLKLSILTLIFSSLLFATNESKENITDFREVLKSEAVNVQKGKNKDFCPICGMTLHNFYKTNFASIANGKESQYCSLICLVEDEIINNKTMKNIRVVDNMTLKLIDAKKAIYIVGSDKPATMSTISIYGFGTLDGAKNFAKKYGGEIKDFDTIYTMIKSTQNRNMLAKQERQINASKHGEMMYERMCKETNEKFKSIADAKSFLISSKICGNMDDKKLQVIAIYLYTRK